MSSSAEVLLGKLALGGSAFVATPLLLYWPVWWKLSKIKFDLCTLTFLTVSRLVFFYLIYIVAGLAPQSDIVCYYRFAKMPLGGLDAHSDPMYCYAPLFQYLIAAALLLWDSAKILILQAILFECVAFPLWIKAGRCYFDEHTVRKAALLYLACPLPLMTTALGGQNQSWIALGLAASICLLAGHREFASGLVQGLTLVAVKFLGLLYAPIFVVCSRKPIRWIMGFAAIFFAVYITFLLRTIDVLTPVRSMGPQYSSGNIWFLLSLVGLPLTDPGCAKWLNVLGAIGIVVVFLGAVTKGAGRSSRDIFYFICLVQTTFVLLSKKSHTGYFVMCFFAVCLVISATKLSFFRLMLFACFGFLTTIEQSLWYRWFVQEDLRIFWRGVGATGPTRLQMVLLILVELSLIALYIDLLAQTWKGLVHQKRVLASERLQPMSKLGSEPV